MKFILCIFKCLALLLPLAGCSSITLVHSWKDQNIPAKQHHKLLIVGISEKPEMRQIFEEVLASEMLKRGINAIPSYTLTGVKEKLSTEALADAVKKSGVDGVITTRQAKVKKNQSTHTGYIMTDRGFASPGLFGPDLYPYDLFGYYGTTVSYATFEHRAVEVTLSTQVTIETSLFDAGTERILWTATTKAVDPESLITTSKGLAEVVLRALIKDGLI